MKDYIHARVGTEERALLKILHRATGTSESALIREGLRLVYQKQIQDKQNALKLAKGSVGRFTSPIKDLSVNKRHLEDYGQ